MTSATDVLAMFEGLRVADVRDGMDWAGLHAYELIRYRDARAETRRAVMTS